MRIYATLTGLFFSSVIANQLPVPLHSYITPVGFRSSAHLSPAQLLHFVSLNFNMTFVSLKLSSPVNIVLVFSSDILLRTYFIAGLWRTARLRRRNGAEGVLEAVHLSIGIDAYE